MTTFKNAAGVAIELRVHTGTAKRVREATGVDLFEWGMHSPDDEPTETLLFRLRADPILLADIIWAIVRPPDASPADEDAFLAALNGDALWRAREALEEEIVNFTRGPERARLEKVRQTVAKLMDRTLAMVTKASQDPRTDQRLEAALTEQEEHFGALLESSESTPTDSPMAS